MEEKSKEKKGRRGLIIFLFILALFVFSVIVMAINSKKPGPISMDDIDAKTKGAAFVIVNLALIEQIYMNWLPNDLFWPTALLDNMPNFQVGVLEVIRYNKRVMRDNLSRMRTTDNLDPYVEGAFTALSNDPYKWWFPSAESKWKKARESLEMFYRNLRAGDAQFFARADNLAELLGQYASLMGGVNTRLINAPGDKKMTLALEETKGTSEIPKMVDIDIPWHRIDDNFYYAQGVAYALRETFKAIRIDFIDILIDKNSIQLADKIIEDLERCDFEPFIVFNGDPDSVFANHSLNLSGVFNDARQKITSLVTALKEG